MSESDDIVQLRERVAALEALRGADQGAVALVADGLKVQIRALATLLFLAVALAGLLLRGH